MNTQMTKEQQYYAITQQILILEQKLKKLKSEKWELEDCMIHID